MDRKRCSCGAQMTTAMLIGMVAGCIAGFVFGWMWRGRPGALADVSLLNAMTALGTVGAVVVALFLSFSAAWSKRGEERIKGAFAVLSAEDRFRRLLQAGSDCRNDILDQRRVDRYDGSYHFFDSAHASVEEISVDELWKFDVALVPQLLATLKLYREAERAISMKERGWSVAVETLDSANKSLREVLDICELARQLIESPTARWHFR